MDCSPHKVTEVRASPILRLSPVEQLANVGSEIERAMRWRGKGNAEYGRRAFERALELLDLSIADEKNRSRLKELTRLREALADYFWFDNSYGSSDESWRWGAQRGRPQGFDTRVDTAPLSRVGGPRPMQTWRPRPVSRPWCLADER